MAQRIGASEKKPQRSFCRPRQADHRFGKSCREEADRDAGRDHPITKPFRTGAYRVLNDVYAGAGGKIRPQLPNRGVKPRGGMDGGLIGVSHVESMVMPTVE